MGKPEERAETIEVPEAARRLGISRALAYRAAAHGELPVIRIGGRILVLRAPFEKLLKGGCSVEHVHV